MAEEIRKVLNLSLGESPKNVRELKADIGELKTAIGDMVIAGKTGTTEYDQAVKLLGQDLQTLLQVNNATKKEVDALDGSYNALVQRMRELKVEWRATNSEARRNELGKQISDINNQLKAFDYSIGNFGRNVGNYGNAWESLGGTIEGVQRSSNNFLSGIASMGAAMGLTSSQSESLNNSLNSVRTTVGILSGAKGVLGLVKAFRSQIAASKEAKAKAAEQAAALNAQKVATDKVTTSTTLATVATNLFKKALMAIGIGVVVVAIGELAAHIQDVIKWFTKLGEKLGIINPQNQALKESNDLLTASIDAQNKALDKEVELMEAKGATQAEVMQRQKTVIAAELAEAKATQVKVKARIDELTVLGKRKSELKALTEQYEKNQQTIADLEHKQAVLDAKIDTNARQAREKAAQERAAAARKAAEDRKKAAADKLKADEEAAKALAKAQEEANKLVNDTVEKGMTEREKLVKEHTETLNKLQEVQAHLTAESYQTAVDAENAYYAKQLSETVSKEYGEAYDKAAQSLQNHFKASNLIKGMSNTIVEAFDAGEFYKDKRKLNEKVAELRNFYDGLITETVKILKNYEGQMNPLAQTALIGLDFDKSFKTVHRLYVKYLEDTEKFLEDYGEPFTTAIERIGKEYEAFAQAHSEGLVEVFNRELEAITEAADGGGIYAVQGAIDRLWLEYSELFDEVDPSGTLTSSMKQYIMRFTGEVSNSIKDVVGASGNATAEAVRQSYEPILNSLYTQMGQWRQAVRNGIVDAKTAGDEIALVEADVRRLTLKRDSEMFTARTKMYQQYSASVSNLLGNVAQAWQNTIRAQVDAGKMSEEQAEKSFERMKAFQYAQAGISTAAAVIQALSDPAVPSFYLRAINAAAALATGVAQVAQIASTHYGSTGTASTATPKLVDRTPVVNTVSLNASEAGDSIQQNMRVYVVESDITEAQSNARARVTESTF